MEVTFRTRVCTTISKFLTEKMINRKNLVGKELNRSKKPTLSKAGRKSKGTESWSKLTKKMQSD